MSKVLVDREVVAQVVYAAFSPYCSQRLGELVPTLRAALKQDPALFQEPVYYRSTPGSGNYKYSRFPYALYNPEPLCAVPQPAQQPELSLTDDEIWEVLKTIGIPTQRPAASTLAEMRKNINALLRADAKKNGLLPAQQAMKPAMRNCMECSNGDSYGLPDRPVCKFCVAGSKWQPLNANSVNPNQPALQPSQQAKQQPKHKILTQQEIDDLFPDGCYSLESIRIAECAILKKNGLLP